jgi:tryptophan synthase alpha chain
VYAVSTMGITGARDELSTLAQKVVGNIRAVSESQNAAVGIGISTAAQVDDVNEFADAAIVGSAFIKAYKTGGLDALVEKTRELAQNLG